MASDTITATISSYIDSGIVPRGEDPISTVARLILDKNNRVILSTDSSGNTTLVGTWTIPTGAFTTLGVTTLTATTGTIATLASTTGTIVTLGTTTLTAAAATITTGTITTLTAPTLGTTTLTATTATVGALTVSGAFSSASLVLGQETVTGAGALSPLIFTSFLVTTGANALTLANGATGTFKYIVMGTDGGDGTLTPATPLGFSTITFNDVGDSVFLQSAGTSGWSIVSSRGVVIT